MRLWFGAKAAEEREEARWSRWHSSVHGPRDIGGAEGVLEQAWLPQGNRSASVEETSLQELWKGGFLLP